MEGLIAQVRSLAAATDDAGRRKLQDTLQEIQFELETPWDMTLRLSCLNVQFAATQVAIDLRIFHHLCEATDPLSLSELATRTNASPELLARILRYLASTHLISQPTPTTFAANSKTRGFISPGFEGAIYHHSNIMGQAVHSLPSFLVNTNYQPISDGLHTPFQQAFHTDLPFFKWATLPEQKKVLHQFQRYMTLPRSAGSFLSSAQVEELILGTEAETIDAKRKLFVDVGGGRGAQSVRLLERYPDAKGKVVLQDLPKTVDGLQVDGVEVLAHDFFNAQPIIGAKIYYLRAILHDHPDSSCISILKNLIPALGPDSRILIDDKILPEMNAHWGAAGHDLNMMSVLGAKERTRSEWEKLVGEAGLRVEHEIVYNEAEGNGVMILVKAQ